MINRSSLIDSLDNNRFLRCSSPMGLDLKDELKNEDWCRTINEVAAFAGKFIKSHATLIAWIGDLLVYGDAHGYKYIISDYAQAAGVSLGTLRNAKMVCRRIPLSCRHDNLSWSHHCEVALRFEAINDIRHWLNLAVENRWSKQKLRVEIRHHLAESKIVEISKEETTITTLLRNVQGISRTVKQTQNSWMEWTPRACATFLEMNPDLVKFIDHMKTTSRGRR